MTEDDAPSHRAGGRALLRDLDREQREAVSAPPGAVLVIAGAGSGKTRVLIRRAAWGVREWGLEPGAVVCVTFTNRAREEMEARLRALVGPRACEVVVGTFHAICHHMLRAAGNAIRVGRTAGFAIADSADQHHIAREATQRAGPRCSALSPREALAAISFAKARCVSPARLAQDSPLMAEVWGHYRALCRELDVLDFEDLIAAASRLLESDPEVRERYGSPGAAFWSTSSRTPRRPSFAGLSSSRERTETSPPSATSPRRSTDGGEPMSG